MIGSKSIFYKCQNQHKMPISTDALSTVLFPHIKELRSICDAKYFQKCPFCVERLKYHTKKMHKLDALENLKTVKYAEADSTYAISY